MFSLHVTTTLFHPSLGTVRLGMDAAALCDGRSLQLEQWSELGVSGAAPLSPQHHISNVPSHGVGR